MTIPRAAEGFGLPRLSRWRSASGPAVSRESPRDAKRDAYDPRMDDVAAFYDGLAEDYTAIFADWDASVRRQAEIIDAIVQQHRPGAHRLLDATCGIGTQAIGLALHGYDVTATDLSPASIERGRREAARLRASVAFGVADVRALTPTVAGPFDVAITFDNALPHLVEPDDLTAALAGLRDVLRPGGLLLVSIRDYDRLASERPSGEPPRLAGPVGGRRMVAQAWEWEADRPVYQLHQFVVREEPSGAWSARHLVTTYRALRRSELSSAASEVGFDEIRWLEPADTGFYQPVLAAERAGREAPWLVVLGSGPARQPVERRGSPGRASEAPTPA